MFSSGALLTGIVLLLAALLVKPRLRELKPQLREFGRRVDRGVTVLVVTLVVVYGFYTLSLVFGGD